MKKLCFNSYNIHIFGQDSHVIWASTSQIHHLLPSPYRAEMHQISDLDLFCFFACFLCPDRSISLGHMTSTNYFAVCFGFFLAVEMQKTVPKITNRKNWIKHWFLLLLLMANRLFQIWKKLLHKNQMKRKWEKIEWSLMKIQIL